VPQFSMLVFDKAYNYYKQFNEWTEKKIYFVTRQKSNAIYIVLKTISVAVLPAKQAGVLKKEDIEVTHKEKKALITLKLRRICYQDEKGRQYVFICNNFIITAMEIALIYKKRWGIELLFKKMKQNFQRHCFYGENDNAIRTQVWCTLIAQLLLSVLQKKAAVKKAFSTVATFIRIHLVSMLDMYELLKNTSRSWVGVKNNDAQPSLFPK